MRSDGLAIEPQRADGGGRSRQQQRGRLVGDLFDGDRAAVVLDQQQRHAETKLGQAGVEGTQIADRARRHVGIQHCSGAALILADDGGDLGRLRDRDVGQGSLGQRRNALFMDRIDVAVEQRDRDGLHAFLSKCGSSLCDVIFVERGQFVAIAIDAARHRQAKVSGHKHGRVGRAMVPWVLALAAANFDGIAKTLGRDHADLGALALQDRVGGDRGAVREQGDAAEKRRGVDAFRDSRGFDGGENTACRIGGNGWHLMDHNTSAVIDDDHVGERSADIHAETESASAIGWRHRSDFHPSVCSFVSGGSSSPMLHVRPCWYL